MTNPRDLAIPSELTLLLARAYLRLLAVGELGERNTACSPSVAADPKDQNPLDVLAQQSDELGAQRGIRRRPCKPA